jgi:hypothetical protein
MVESQMAATAGHSTNAEVRSGSGGDAGMRTGTRVPALEHESPPPAGTREGALLAHSMSEALAASAREARP